MTKTIKENTKKLGTKNSKKYSKKWLENMKKTTITPPLLLTTTKEYNKHKVHLFGTRGKRKTGHGTLQTSDQNLPIEGIFL